MKRRSLANGPWKGMVPVFVYGTLMTGRTNNDRMIALGCIPAEPEAYAPGLVIHHVTGVGFPAAIKGESQALGEVWWIPLTSLPLLDQFEACYHRERILVWGSRRSYNAFTYIWKRSHGGLGSEVKRNVRWKPEAHWYKSGHYSGF